MPISASASTCNQTIHEQSPDFCLLAVCLKCDHPFIRHLLQSSDRHQAHHFSSWAIASSI
ncbi:MAG: hypothetical protein RMX68_006060 [Aulosira sp. ZfuVER01]|nr:hypothetical protein [Aulosira sp. ZfuVER01]MDZ8001488.1 hypothetical protein [Aulosira sp. DedVER01a]MDZ8051644.1 hypothetical protein [Aulosira sp. ZfuCHP01]